MRGAISSLLLKLAHWAVERRYFTLSRYISRAELFVAGLPRSGDNSHRRR
jgi:hypothetical protein